MMVADPRPTPLSCGGERENVFPAEIKTLEVAVTIAVLLLDKETVTQAAGAGVDRVTGNITD